MSEMQEYRSSLSDPASRKFETFSYLPAMDKAQIRKQVAYIVGKGWNAAIEHTEPENAFGSRDPQLIHNVERDRIPAEVKLEIGAVLEAKAFYAAVQVFEDAALPADPERAKTLRKLIGDVLQNRDVLC